MKIKCLFISLFVFGYVLSVQALTMDEAVSLALMSEDSVKKNELLAESAMYSSRSSLAAFMPSVDLKYQYSDTKLNDKIMPEVKSKNSDFSLEVGFNVFNGLKDIRMYQIGKMGYEIQSHVADSNRQEIILDTKTAYINYLKAQKQLNVAEETLSLLQAQKSIAEVSYKVGQFSRSDVLRVDVQLASTQLDLLNAQIALKLAKQKLEKFIGREIAPREAVIDIKVKDGYEIPALNDIYSMLEVQSDMMAVKGNYEVADLTKKQSVSGYMPKVNLGYQKHWYGDKSDPFTGRKALDKDGFDKSDTIAVSAQWNIFTGFYDYHTYLSNASKAESAAFNVSDMRKNMRLQASSTFENYFSAKERQQVSEVAVSQARESYRVTESQYANSEATTTDLLNASVALNSALTANYVANYDLIIAITEIERIIEKGLNGFENLQ